MSVNVDLYHVFWLVGPHGLWDLSSPTKNRTRAFGNESAESKSLYRQGIPYIIIFLMPI